MTHSRSATFLAVLLLGQFLAASECVTCCPPLITPPVSQVVIDGVAGKPITEAAFTAIKKSKDYIIFAKPASAANVNILLTSSISKPHIFAIIPDTEPGLIAMWPAAGAHPGPLLEEMRRNREAWEKIQDVHIIDGNGAGQTADDFLANLHILPKRSSFILFGHNENGQILFPHGPPLAHDALIAAALKNQVYPIVLSCETARYAKQGPVTLQRLDFEKTAGVVDRALRALPPAPRYADLLHSLNAEFTAKLPDGSTVRMTLSVLGGVMVVVAVVEIIDS